MLYILSTMQRFCKTLYKRFQIADRLVAIHHPHVFDRLQYTNCKQPLPGGADGLGVRLCGLGAGASIPITCIAKRVWFTTSFHFWMFVYKATHTSCMLTP